MTAKEDKEKDKMGREQLGKFFYDLSKVCFTSMVIGSTVLMFTSDNFNMSLIPLNAIGIIATYYLAYTANKIIKR